MIGVYLILNSANGKGYVGSSIDVERRFKAHKRALDRGAHINAHLQAAYNKYGRHEFVFSVLEETSLENLVAVEQLHMDRLGVVGCGYNMCPVAESVGSLPKSAEHKAKIGAAHKGVKRSDQAKANMSAAMSGKKRGPMSEERKAKIAASNTGKVRTAEARAKLSAYRTGVKTGPCTPERKAAISAAQKRRHAAMRGAEE